MGFPDHGHFVWSVGAVLTGLLAALASFALTQGDDGLFTLLLVLGLAGISLGLLGVVSEFRDREVPPFAVVQPPTPETSLDALVPIPVEGGDDTITVNLFHLLQASWSTTIDLVDGTTLVASTHGDTLEIRDSRTGVITQARVDPSGSVMVRSVTEVPTIVAALRVLADRLTGSGDAYEPSVTGQSAPEPVTARSHPGAEP